VTAALRKHVPSVLLRDTATHLGVLMHADWHCVMLPKGVVTKVPTLAPDSTVLCSRGHSGTAPAPATWSYKNMMTVRQKK
jgi:hypothetical protein